MQSSTAVLSAQSVSVYYGSNLAVRQVSLDIPRGEIVAFIGPSGCGKTTLLNAIAGFHSINSGSIHLDGELLCGDGKPQAEPGPDRIVVFQNGALFPWKTVLDNVAFALPNASKAQRSQSARDALAACRVGELALRKPGTLSGGQQQRVALARALAFKPGALLFDEPFSALDAVTRLDLRREVRALLREMKIPALFITHDQEEALELADRILVLNHGQIEQVGPPFEVYNHPRNEFVAAFLGAANILLGRWTDGRVSLGRIRLRATPDAPLLAERQPVKIIFRPEDVTLNFQPQLLDTPYILGRAVIEDISYIGHSERLIARLMLWENGSSPAPRQTPLSLVDETLSEGFPLLITRNKWDAGEMELGVGDTVAVGLKGYRLLPHYPLRSETGAKAL